MSSKMEITHDDIIRITDANCFPLVSTSGNIEPTIVVFRNTKKRGGSYQFEPDTGDNCCDTVCLVDTDAVIALTGRSYPHVKYQKQQVDKTGAANYIASGFFPMAFRHGKHKGLPALVQDAAFTIWRSRDMQLHIIDETPDDDFVETDIVANNFHGCAPYSAGCITVFGAMNPPANDWAVALEWAYKTHEEQDSFHAIVLEHEDFISDRVTLRLGSMGSDVEKLQAFLAQNGLYRLKWRDGLFGPVTFDAVRAYQKANNLPDTGIWFNEYYNKVA